MATRYPIRIKAAPKVGNIYWCDFHPEGVIHIPEFWKKRPVIGVSRNATLHGKVTILPMTTDEDNASNINAIELSAEVQSKIDNKRTWVICDHLTTIATSRLDNVSTTPPRVKGDELTAILRKAHATIAGWVSAPIVTVTEVETTRTVETPSGSLAETMDTITIRIEEKPAR
ncbi:type II toxin-antitoxin system PemK/MazF family toxin [Rhizobium glycinendophyticum]|uniref:type II toxin-antitoxin system PemK/MazF family toxin n=1 Tax=Rhizobium glycinendophyticum TaxID=2589807 RepID=UPI0013759E9C|nr:type II toxin-antitoxin system PemK/MazF family toxin [Rhizobium glycinendophyticum]